MTPKQLYALPPIHVGKSVDGAIHAFPELDQYETYEANSRIEVRWLANECFDGERGWELSSVWIDNQPFMIITGAGRGNRDHQDRFITDEALYWKAVEYLRSLVPAEPLQDLTDLDADLPDLTRFYGRSLEEFYRPEGVDPAYKIGDIVIARVIRDHIHDAYVSDPPMVESRILITEVRPHNPSRTYSGLQLDRARGPFGAGMRMVHAPGKGGVYADFDDSAVLGPGPEEPIHPQVVAFRAQEQRLATAADGSL